LVHPISRYFLGCKIIASLIASFLSIDMVTLFQKFSFFKSFSANLPSASISDLPESPYNAFQIPQKCPNDDGYTMRIWHNGKRQKYLYIEIMLNGKDMKMSLLFTLFGRPECASRCFPFTIIFQYFNVIKSHTFVLNQVFYC
jgi:hypothetical protein